MTAQEYTLTIRLDDGAVAEARTSDQASINQLKRLMRDPKWSRRMVRVATLPGDTSGHMIADDTLTVSLGIDGDVEGHTMTLHFPSAEEARRLQKRLLITGVLAASIVAGAAGANLAVQQGQQQHAIPAAGPAMTIPKAVDSEKIQPNLSAPSTNRVTPGSIDAQLRDGSAVSRTTTSPISPASIDAQLRDSSAVSGTTTGPISPAKDAKDAQASGGSATDSTTDSSSSGPGSRTTYPQ